eukprot:comp6182_c0_seq1/m.2016 comp6182_c0_seq1/g.2016  ORF comp6182_c0_seq1/g.2016 comp6182_c0_seq1/m.2016 type:complete len:114 (+) comp6182_c0_seq1:679-1020(+)
MATVVTKQASVKNWSQSTFTAALAMATILLSVSSCTCFLLPSVRVLAREERLLKRGKKGFARRCVLGRTRKAMFAFGLENRNLHKMFNARTHTRWYVRTWLQRSPAPVYGGVS